MKKKYYIGLGLILFESIVMAHIPNRYYLDNFACRVNRCLCYQCNGRPQGVCICDLWLPLATIVLSLLSVDNKYKSLEAEKIK